MPEINSNSPISETERKWAALSYVWILWIIPMLLKRDSVFVQFHAKQGLLLFVAEVICSIIPIIGWLVGLILLVLAVLGVLESLQGKFWEMPILGKYVKKINL